MGLLKNIRKNKKCLSAPKLKGIEVMNIICLQENGDVFNLNTEKIINLMESIDFNNDVEYVFQESKYIITTESISIELVTNYKRNKIIKLAVYDEGMTETIIIKNNKVKNIERIAQVYSVLTKLKIKESQSDE